MTQFESLTPEEAVVAKTLETAAQGTNPSPQFRAELEERLVSAHKPRAGFNLSARREALSALGLTGALVVLAFFLNWAIRALAPEPQPAIDNPPSSCPVTEPNGSLPPGETAESPYYLGNGEIWTGLWPDGKVLMLPENQEADGSFSMKWWWWRGGSGALIIEGRRLDAEAEPLRADIPEGYGDTGFQVAALIFPTTGCWEVTGRVGDASLTFVTEVVFGAPTPTPAPVINDNVTPEPEGEAYNWHGTTLYLNAPFPESPAEANVYLYQPEERAAIESARGLATQFGLNGAIYQSIGEIPGSADFLIVDGNQRLHVRSDQYFQYYPDYPRYISVINGATPPANAAAVIDEFLKSHGFDFAYELLPSEMYGGVVAAPLTPDGRVICYEYFKCAGLRFTLDDMGILLVDGALPRYETFGRYGIISAEEAFQLLLHPENISSELGATGTMEGMHSYSPPVQTWLRPRPADQTLTLFGWLSSIPSLEGGAPLVTLDGFTVTGNTADIPASLENTFVEATGQFREENGVRTFALEAWKVYDGYEDGLLGTISRQDSRVILNTLDGETLILPDTPSDLPLPLDNAFVIGVRVGESYEWKSIDLRSMSGGGGGGGGFGFFKLNLTGAPVPFPTPRPTTELDSGEPFAYTVVAGDSCQSIAYAFRISAEELINANNMPADCSTLTVGQTLNIPAPASLFTEKVEGMRGTMNIVIYKQADGGQRVEYGFMGSAEPYPYFILEGGNLEELQAYQNKPVDVWGTVEYKEAGAILTVERYEIPFPDLQFQILRGTQASATIEGQPVTLFTTDAGETYVQFYPGGGVDDTLMSKPGDVMLIEALTIPGETFGGYPVVRIYSASMAVNPKNGEAAELQISAGQVYVVDEALEGEYVPPTLTIQRIQLIYYMPDPRYLAGPLEADQRYLQPVWLFTGRYSDGNEYQFLIQALDPEFLLPEPAPYTAPG